VCDWISFVKGYLKKRELAQAEDIYKLVYQGFFGSEHAISDHIAVAKWLKMEWDEVEESEGELLEPIHPCKCMYRLNLGPAKHQKIPCDDVLFAFVSTAIEKKQSITQKDIEKEGETGNIRSGNEQTGISPCNERQAVLSGYEGQSVLSCQARLSQFKNAVKECVVLATDGDTARCIKLSSKALPPSLHHSSRYKKAYNPHYRVVDEVAAKPFVDR